MVSVLVGTTVTSFWDGLLKVEGFAPGHGESIDVADVISNMADFEKHSRARARTWNAKKKRNSIKK